LRATLLLHLAVFCLVYGQIRPGTITGSVNDGTGSAVTTAAVSIVNQETSISGDVAWRNPLGSFDELDALGVPATGTPEPRGGPIATGGGVLFIGATIDARFRALDANRRRALDDEIGRHRQGGSLIKARTENSTWQRSPPILSWRSRCRRNSRVAA